MNMERLGWIIEKFLAVMVIACSVHSWQPLLLPLVYHSMPRSYAVSIIGLTAPVWFLAALGASFLLLGKRYAVHCFFVATVFSLLGALVNGFTYSFLPVIYYFIPEYAVIEGGVLVGLIAWMLNLLFALILVATRQLRDQAS